MAVQQCAKDQAGVAVDGVLLELALGVVERSYQLVSWSRDQWPSALDDLRKVAASAERLQALLRDANAPEGEPPGADVLRHEIRTPLNHILGYGELLL
jgi:signal transduction histidine kinase